MNTRSDVIRINTGKNFPKGSYFFNTMCEVKLLLKPHSIRTRPRANGVRPPNSSRAPVAAVPSQCILPHLYPLSILLGLLLSP